MQRYTHQSKSNEHNAYIFGEPKMFDVSTKTPNILVKILNKNNFKIS